MVSPNSSSYGEPSHSKVRKSNKDFLKLLYFYPIGPFTKEIIALRCDKHISFGSVMIS